jgi:twinkle protein
MSWQEVQMCEKALNNNIWFVKPDKDFTLESILEHVKQLKLKHGVDCFVIDAWNKLEHKHNGTNETKYIGESLDKLAIFCELYNVHCFLVAHPRKINKDKLSGKYELPTLYDVAGSANFYNKTDNGIAVYRDAENKTWVYVQKVKFSHWGEIGCSEFTYHKSSGRYIEQGSAYTEGSWIMLANEPLKENNNFLTQTNDDPF